MNTATIRRAGYALAVLIVLAFVAMVGGLWLFQGYGPDPSRYPVRGIDVSHHQGPVDWRAVAGDHVAFAYLKATEGGDYRDDQFAGNWKAARRAGVAVGAYHFFSFCSPGRAQAANFLKAVPRAPDALPPAVDLEFGGNCGAPPQPEALRRELDAFLAVVERASGRRAVLYVTPDFMKAYGAVLPERALWRRSILHRPGWGEGWTLWQYHNRGKVAGVAGPVDMNVYGGSREGFARWARMAGR